MMDLNPSLMVRSDRSDVDDVFLRLKPSRDPIDDWIVEAFSRPHVQLKLFKQSYQHPCLVLQASVPEPPITIFHSVNEA